MLKTAIAALTVLLLTITQAPAQTVADVNAQMQAMFGASEPFAEAFDAIKAAFASGDPAEVAPWVAYPFRVAYDDEEIVAEDADAFVAEYDAIVTPDIVEAVAGQSYETLFVNDSGVMFGDGQVWMTLICEDDGCARSAVRIIAIQSVIE